MARTDIEVIERRERLYRHPDSIRLRAEANHVADSPSDNLLRRQYAEKQQLGAKHVADAAAMRYRHQQEAARYAPGRPHGQPQPTLEARHKREVDQANATAAKDRADMAQRHRGERDQLRDARR